MVEPVMIDTGQRSVAPRDFEPIEDAWFLTGPTAAGKTLVGVELAERLDAEIVSLDSMAIYRGMDVGTAKPDPEIRRRVPHHLLDIVDPTEEFSVSQYAALAHDVVHQIRQRGKQVLFVGGTPLYLKALLRGLSPGPPADWQFRRQAEDEARRLGVEALYRQLEVLDPLAAAKLHPHDLRRIIRALEVFHLTGQPISHHQLQFEEGRPAEECHVFVLAWPRSVLHQRIEKRVERMFQRGLITEVQNLLNKYGTLSRTAAQAVGYYEVQRYLAGEWSYEYTVERVKVRTRQFARRQETWLRHTSECTWVAVTEEDTPSRIAQRILERASLRATKGNP